jgi:hypothetical protein
VYIGRVPNPSLMPNFFQGVFPLFRNKEEEDFLPIIPLCIFVELA